MAYEKLKQDIEKEIRKNMKHKFEHDDIFKNHMIPVMNYSSKLAKIYKADKDVVELAALLHDIAYTQTKENENHEIIGAEIAERMLKGKVPNEKIELIKKCIMHHRGAKNYKRETKEEQIVACADAMSHIDNSLIFMYLWGASHKGLEPAQKWLKEKIQRGWKKITLPEGRKMVKDKYEAIMLLLN
ncbi:MAG: HD domain-containing protein [Nanoarchaeota archaeon]|nr:HD domain-containing protein [Nanoarchaeota archaeon]